MCGAHHRDLFLHPLTTHRVIFLPEDARTFSGSMPGVCRAVIANIPSEYDSKSPGRVLEVFQCNMMRGLPSSLQV